MTSGACHTLISASSTVANYPSLCVIYLCIRVATVVNSTWKQTEFNS